jgi:hypothetical protein
MRLSQAALQSQSLGACLKNAFDLNRRAVVQKEKGIAVGNASVSSCVSWIQLDSLGKHPAR